jgi:uncharacterized integral membrane protein
MRTVKMIFLVVVGVLVVIMMIQNAQPITFRFLNWSYEVSQLLLVTIVLVLGFLAGFITAKVTRGSKAPEEP